MSNQFRVITFQNLTDGSENHPRTFVARYEALKGKIYIPAYLDQNTYQQIINGTSDSDNSGVGRKGGGNGGT